jgi:membrane-associated phospholipid phosphatase
MATGGSIRLGGRRWQVHQPLDRSTRLLRTGRPPATRWRRLRDGVPSALCLLSRALVLLAALVALGWLLAKVVHDDGIGRADSGLSRWLAGERTHDHNSLTRWTTLLSETITVTVLAVLTVAITAFVWRRWREPMLVAVAGEVGIFLATTLLVDRQRPPVSHLDEAPPTSSFPSGHTAAAICLYGALAVLASQRARSALVRWLTSSWRC